MWLESPFLLVNSCRFSGSPSFSSPWAYKKPRHPPVLHPGHQLGHHHRAGLWRTIRLHRTEGQLGAENSSFTRSQPIWVLSENNRVPKTSVPSKKTQDIVDHHLSYKIEFFWGSPHFKFMMALVKSDRSWGTYT